MQGAAPRAGSLLLHSSPASLTTISLTSLASDSIVDTVSSLTDADPARPPPALSSTSQAAWRGLASTSTNPGEAPSKPKKSALLSRIFNKPPAAKQEERKEEKEENEKEEVKEDEGEAAKVELPKRAHKLLPQRTQAMLDTTADPASRATISPPPPVANVHLPRAGEKEKVKKAKKKKAEAKEKEKGKRKVRETVLQEELSKRSSRRSSMDFVKPPRARSSSASSSSTASLPSATQATTSTKGRRARAPLPSIVCTSCHRDDSALVRDLAKKLGAFTVSSSVTASTTHVISGEGKRTLNLLKGLMQGCWLLTKEWAYSSLEEGRWAPEEPFEMVNFSPAVRNMRQDRIAAGGSFKSELFKDVGTVYVSRECRAPRDELMQLVTSGGGTVGNTARVASVVVGEFREGDQEGSTDCVTEKWILDSVQFHVVMPFSDYPL